ncbi:MAG: LLM class flavin-dependent oxidoreductase, partial [Mycobacteriaceae bacterium]
HLEEAYQFGEGVRPALERRGLVQDRNVAHHAEPIRAPFIPAAPAHA